MSDGTDEELWMILDFTKMPIFDNNRATIFSWAYNYRLYFVINYFILVMH